MSLSIKKYWVIFITGIKNAINYRAELILWSVIDGMPLLAMLVLWLNAFGSNSMIAGYTQQSLIAYYISGYIFQDVTGCHFEEDMIKEIKSGKISTYLLRPFSLKRYLVTSEISWRFLSFIVSVMPVIILTLIFGRHLMPAITPFHWFIIPVVLFLAYIMEAIYSLMIVAFGFIFEEARSLMHLKWMLGWLFSGSMIPFEFMPNWLSKLSSWLPFKFRYYIPNHIYFGSITGTSLIMQIGLQIGWLIILIVILKSVWSRCLKKFTAVGN